MSLKTNKSAIMDFIKKYGYPVGLGGLFVIAFFLRAYRIDSLPNVLYVDEASVGYNAWCLTHYGVDRYLHEWPIYPQNSYGGQSPLYTYCLAILFKIFREEEPSMMLLRVPALLSSMLTVICTSVMTKMIFCKKWIIFAGTALVTFCPYFIMSGRYAYDCNMMLGTSLLAITLLIYFLRKKSWSSLVLCGLGFALVLYSYSLSYIIIPVFLIMCTLFLLYTREINISKVIILAGVIVMAALPIVLFVVCLVFNIPEIQLGGIHIYPVSRDRMGEIVWRNLWTAFLECIKCTLTNDGFLLDAVDKFYTMYLISIPFIIIGFVSSLVSFIRSVWKRAFTVDAIFLLFFLAVMFTVGISGKIRIYRANAIFVSYLFFCINGIYVITYGLHRYRKVSRVILLIGYAVWSVSFLKYYFISYSPADMVKYPNSFYFVPEKMTFDYVVENAGEYNVYVDSYEDEYVTFFYPVSPYDWRNKSPFNENGDFSYVVKEDTPIEMGSIYMVRKENSEFLEKLYSSSIEFETKEFEYYYVFILP